MSDPKLKPRVLHLITAGGIAGAEQALVDLAYAHDHIRWDIRFATLYEAGEMNEKIKACGLPCYDLKFRGSADLPLAVLRLSRLLRRLHVDVLHTHLVHASAVGLLATRITRFPPSLVHTRHHTDALYRFGLPIKAKIDGFVARRQEAVCAVCQAAREILVGREGVHPERVRITYPGADIERIVARVTDPTGQRVRREFGISKEAPLLGVVAHLVPKKGHAYLLAAMPQILERAPDARLLLVGHGSEAQSLEAEAGRLGLSHAVSFAGYRDDIPDVLSALDILVQPSLEEGLPLSLIEGMALARPIVATAISGIPELVEADVTGILVPPADSAALAQAVCKLLENPGKRQQMGCAGQLRAQQLFTVSRLARDYETVWEDVLS